MIITSEIVRIGGDTLDDQLSKVSRITIKRIEGGIVTASEAIGEIPSSPHRFWPMMVKIWVSVKMCERREPATVPNHPINPRGNILQLSIGCSDIYFLLSSMHMPSPALH